MDYIPKKDWVTGEILMHTDMNRIESGIEESFTSSKGDKGDMGEAGPQGPIGETGLKGDTGDIGPRGPIGPQGPQGSAGPQGEVGPSGSDGMQGLQGPIGPEGPEGPIGPAGLTWRGQYNPSTEYVLDDAVSYMGATYFCLETITGVSPLPENPSWALLAAQGARGPAGIDGTIGPQGPKGDQGVQGVRGVEGPQGPVGPKGDIGRVRLKGTVQSESELTALVPSALVGDAYWIGGTLYIFTDDPSLVSGPDFLRGNNLTGPIGPQGIQGPKGDKGDKGDVGATGAQGASGSQGIQGAKGDTGERGIQGLQGSPGIQGIQGVKGDTGAKGDTGPVYTPVLSVGTISTTAFTGFNYTTSLLRRVGRLGQFQFTLTTNSAITVLTRVIGNIPVGFRPSIQTRQNFISDKGVRFYAALETNGDISLLNFAALETGDILHFRFSYINDSAS